MKVNKELQDLGYQFLRDHGHRKPWGCLPSPESHCREGQRTGNLCCNGEKLLFKAVPPPPEHEDTPWLKNQIWFSAACFIVKMCILA